MQRKTVERRAEEFMKDVTIVWTDRGKEFRVQEYDWNEFVRFGEDCYFGTA